MYSLIGESETCPAEIAAYGTRYNVRIIPVSPAGGYAEVTSFLLSLYGLVHRVDSSIVATDVVRIIDTRGGTIGIPRVRRANFSKDEDRALRLLSVFREPVELSLFTALCTDNGIHLTPAHYHLNPAHSPSRNVGQEANWRPSEAILVS